MKQYEIHDIDYLEGDAHIVINDRVYYFQFNGEPSKEKALIFLVNDEQMSLETARFHNR
jgi:hypothetical protein